MFILVSKLNTPTAAKLSWLQTAREGYGLQIVNIHKIFNSFLNIFLRIYFSSFPLTQVKSKMNQNSWIAPGIITSWKYKRELNNEMRNNNNATLVSYYRDCSKILPTVMRKTKGMEHDKLILNSHNKVKTTWGITNKQSERNKERSEIQALKVEGKIKRSTISLS